MKSQRSLAAADAPALTVARVSAQRLAERHDRRLGYRFLMGALALLCLLSYARYRMLTGGDQFGVILGLLDYSTCYLPWIFLTPIVFRLEQRYSPVCPFRWRSAVMLLLLGLPISVGNSYLAQNTSPFVYWCFYLGRRAAPFVVVPRLSEVELQFSLYVIALATSAFLSYRSAVRATEQRAAQLALEKAELEGALRQAELETLRMRLNPHFLFNCLQNIAALAGDDARAAGTMLARLGDLLRVALRSDYQSEVSLAEEIRLTQAYLSIEQVRFGDRLSVLFAIDPRAEHARVPSLLLQPLVENAIKHGLSGVSTGGIIWIRASLADSNLSIVIRDNGRGITPAQASGEPGRGIGLSATRERLERIYGEHQLFSIRSLPERGTEVAVTLPLSNPPEAARTPAPSLGNAAAQESEYARTEATLRAHRR